MNLDIEEICPLHGPILNENLVHYIEKYNIWSSYKAESDGVYIACASIHGNTYSACEKLKEILEEKGFTIDEAGFKAAMEEQREKARKARKFERSFSCMISEDIYNSMEGELRENE